MREAIKIMRQLIMKGSINDRDDAALFDYARTDEIQYHLELFAEEWNFHLVKTAHELYIVPLQNNEMFNIRLREVRKNVGYSARNIDAYLQCYIIMVILWMFFGSKNGNPQSTQSLRIQNIVKTLDERFAGKNDLTDMDSLQINFQKIADKWNSSITLDEGRKNKTELVKTACRFLKSQDLILFLDNEDEIRTKKRLTDLMINYYLSDKRITEIHEIFDKENHNAGN